MGVVTGESCVFVARFQIVLIPSNTTASQLMKTVYPIGHFITEPEQKGGGMLRGQTGSLGVKSHMPRKEGVRKMSEGL